MADKPRAGPAWASHLATVLVTGITMMIGWTVFTVNQNQLSIVSVEERLSSLSVREDNRGEHVDEELSEINEKLDNLTALITTELGAHKITMRNGERNGDGG
ncbi:hypothetical protein ABXV18_24785 [Vibrio owensii]|uniref:hypothetical protein n=1 Tax=Vibrio owensii TaxID=696485 RepID=UPI00339B3F0D